LSAAAPGPTRRLAHWLAQAPDLLGGAALPLARDGIMDVVACMVAGAGDEVTGRVSAGAASWGDGRCSVVGREERRPPAVAALVNGTAAHALDFDDNFHPLAGHGTAVIVPAALAAAESAGGTGRGLLDAYVAGLEVAARIGDAVNLAHYERGWHSTATIGAFAAAAACARARRLDADAAARALGIAFSLAGGSKRQFGTMAKPLHAGLAAMHGVMACDLAGAGVDPSPEPLDGRWGFRDLFADDAGIGFEAALESLGTELAIERYGLKAKIHPCCASVHCAVDAVLALRAEHRLGPRDIRRVEVVVLPVSYHNLMYPRPTTGPEARFSMHYCIALAVLQERLTLADFTVEGVARAEVREWLERVEMRLPGPQEAIAGADNGREPAEVHLHLADGATLSRFVQHARGVKENPMSPGELAAKLRDCTGPSLEPARRDRLAALLAGLEAAPGLDELLGLLREVAAGDAPSGAISLG
jgi:2-methylcitrate dehydratase PrpD